MPSWKSCVVASAGVSHFSLFKVAYRLLHAPLSFATSFPLRLGRVCRLQQDDHDPHLSCRLPSRLVQLRSDSALDGGRSPGRAEHSDRRPAHAGRRWPVRVLCMPCGCVRVDCAVRCAHLPPRVLPWVSLSLCIALCVALCIALCIALLCIALLCISLLCISLPHIFPALVRNAFC